MVKIQVRVDTAGALAKLTAAPREALATAR